MIMGQNGRIDPEITGKFIAELRKSHNLTQEELADRLFITRKAVSKWETGRACPSIDILKRLSDSFGVPLEDFISGKLSENREFKDGKIVVRNPEFKINKKLLVIIIAVIMAILSIIFSNLDTSLVYNISYQDEELLIQNGSVIFSSNNGIFDLGEVTLNETNQELNPNFYYSLYIKENNKYKNILKSNVLNLVMIDTKNSIILKKTLRDGSKELYIKFFNISNKKKETGYLRLLVEKQYEAKSQEIERTNLLNENLLKDTLSELLSTENLNNKVTEYPFSLKVIDLKWLFKNEKKNLNNKIINVKGQKFKIEYKKEEAMLSINSKELDIEIFLDSKCIGFSTGVKYLFAEEEYKFRIETLNKKEQRIFLMLLNEIRNFI